MSNSIDLLPNKCKHCGADLTNGLLANIDHWWSCKPHREDEKREGEERAKYWQEKQREADKEFAPVFNAMTEEERNELLGYSLAGTIDSYGPNGNIRVLMGMEGIKRIDDFKQKMRDKYK